MGRFKDVAAVEQRIRDLREWLEKNAPESLKQQKHLDEGTQERVYWTYGYMVALRDVLHFVTDKLIRRQYNADKPSSFPST